MSDNVIGPSKDVEDDREASFLPRQVEQREREPKSRQEGSFWVYQIYARVTNFNHHRPVVLEFESDTQRKILLSEKFTRVPVDQIHGGSAYLDPFAGRVRSLAKAKAIAWEIISRYEYANIEVKIVPVRLNYEITETSLQNFLLISEEQSRGEYKWLHDPTRPAP